MKVLIAGDYCDKLRVDDSIYKNNYGVLFDNIKPTIENVDYSIVNFEFPIVTSSGSPIRKCGPNLKGRIESIDAIKYAGFKCCTLANNHILDQGPECGKETKLLLERSGIDTVGFGNNVSEAEHILYKVICGEKLAIINCCEHEFSIATDSSPGSNALNPVKLFYVINEARQRADYVFVITHGGHEHFNLPSPRMKETYRFFIDVGADVVVNHHQHCFSGYEIYNGKPIFYGLGNFLFDNISYRHTFWNEGYMVSFELSSDSLDFNLIPYTQCNDLPTIQLLSYDEKQKFTKKINELNHIISDDKKLALSVYAYYEKCKKNELSLLEPYHDKITYKLFRMGLLPKFIKGKKITTILNHVDCESHRDKLLYALTKENNQ